jgi:hypothetical protein
VGSKVRDVDDLMADGHDISRWAGHDHVLAAFDEGELVQTLDLLAAATAGGEITIVELVDRGQPARAHRL